MICMVIIPANYTSFPKRDYLTRYRIDLIFFRLIHILILNVFSYLRFSQCTHKNAAILLLFPCGVSYRLPCCVSWVSIQYDTCITRQYVIDSFFWRLFIFPIYRNNPNFQILQHSFCHSHPHSGWFSLGISG